MLRWLCSDAGSARRAAAPRQVSAAGTRQFARGEYSPVPERRLSRCCSVLPSFDAPASMTPATTNPMEPSRDVPSLAQWKVLLVPRHLLALIGSVTLVVIVIDQISKLVMAEWLGPEASSHRWEVAGRLLAFEYVENTGAAFGMLSGRSWLLSVLAVAVAGMFVILLRAEVKEDRAYQLAIGMILGGAAGNLIDRLRLGYVIDFIAVGTWPKFNVADSCITLGVVVVVFSMLREDDSRPSVAEPPSEHSAYPPSREGYLDHHERNDGGS